MPRKLNCLWRGKAIQKSIPAFVTDLLLPTTTFLYILLNTTSSKRVSGGNCVQPPPKSSFKNLYLFLPYPSSAPPHFLILVAQSLTLHKHFLVSFLIGGGFSCGNNNIAVVAVEESSEQIFGRLRSLKSKQYFLQPRATTFYFRSCILSTVLLFAVIFIEKCLMSLCSC